MHSNELGNCKKEQHARDCGAASAFPAQAGNGARDSSTPFYGTELLAMETALFRDILGDRLDYDARAAREMVS